MTDHATRCRDLSLRLGTLPVPGPALIGFDGFVDQIISVVKTRRSPTDFTRMPGIATLAKRLAEAAGQSTNLELVVERTKIGGNGPIMALAMQAQGTPVTAVGLLGHEVFQPLADGGSTVVSLGPPAVTDALEFTDGKVMLGKLGPLAAIAPDAIERSFGGRERLRDGLRHQRLIATVNWTMTLAMPAIWAQWSTDVLPGLWQDRPRWFVDLADPVKRPVEDLRQALSAMTGLQRFAEVVLGLNGSECRQVVDCLGLEWPDHADDTQAAALACAAIRRATGLAMVMCHKTASAACAWDGGQAVSDGFLCAAPRITTGAGDHFNAGFCAGLLSGLTPADALLVGGATSGCYVRDAQSPGRARLAGFLADWARGIHD